MVNAKVLLDSADLLQEVIHFFREARNVLGSDFKPVEPKADVFEFGLNVCEPFAHLFTLPSSANCGDLASASRVARGGRRSDVNHHARYREGTT